MKKIRFALSLAILMALLISGIGLAAETAPNAPEAVTSIIVSPDPVFVGEEVDITMNYDNDFSSYTQAAVCVYFRPSGSISSWQANFPASVNGLDASYTRVDSPLCPDLTFYDDFYYASTDASGLFDGDTLEFSNVIVPTVPTGTNYVAFRLYAGADCDNSAGDSSDVPGSANCPVRSGTRNRTFTVNAFPSSVYIGNSGCGGSTPCFTGAAGLQNAIDAVPSGGTINVYGAYVGNAATLGAKNITMQPVDTSSSLGGAGTCSGSLLTLDSTGNLTINGLALTGSGACATALSVTGSGSLTLDRATVSGWSGTAVNVTSGSATLHGNTFSSNVGYAYQENTGTVTAFGNNISGNNGAAADCSSTPAYQAVATTAQGSAKNWWGTFSNSACGPTNTAGWESRLGSSVKSLAWGAVNGTATLGGAALSPQVGGSGTPIVIDLGRGSLNAPFGNGIPPYVNRTCSAYYDYYVLGGSGNWRAQLPIDTSTDCIANVLNQEVAYTIDPAAYDTHCITSNNTQCWQRIPDTAIQVSPPNMLITLPAADFTYTHIAAGDESGADPTAIELNSVTAESARNTWLPLALLAVAIGLGGFGVYAARKQRS